jgi:hypothetical protein
LVVLLFLRRSGNYCTKEMAIKQLKNPATMDWPPSSNSSRCTHTIRSKPIRNYI